MLFRSADRAEAMRGRAGALDELGIEEFSRTRSPVLFAPTAPDDLIAHTAQLMIDSVRMPVYQWACNSMADTDHRADLGLITAPTLVIYGDQDAVTPPSLSRQLAAGIAGADLVEIADAGHLANQEQPAAFNGAVASFLTTRSPLGSH